MESTNSGSIQSSSSADNEEYDAVVDSPVPSFLNLPPPPPPPPATTPPATSSIFDSFSPYFTPFLFQPPPSQEHAATWPLSPPPPPPPLSTSAPSGTRGGPTPPPVQSPAAAPRGPKKRTRASRREPTTVINTETSNFRSMVQQFTGFPSPPFSTAAATPQFQSPGLQLDLFGSSAAAVPQFLLRPSAQKMIPSPASSSASPSLFDHIIARSNLASIGNPSITSADVDGAPKYHDKFPLSLFEQQPDAANRGAERGSFMPPAFLQPQRAQMAQLPAEFAGGGSLGRLIATGGGGATNITNNNRPRSDIGLYWDVNEQSGEERRRASSIEDQQPYQKLWRPNLD